jgi:hypothetical protein
LGRVKIRVQNIFEDIPKNDIPWASCFSSVHGKSFNIPALGKIVNVIFDGSILYNPIYINTDNYNINLQDKLESLSDKDYNNFVALLFDDRTRIYSETDDFTIDFLINKIKMTSDSINLELKDNSRKINLGAEDANQSAVLGNHFIMEWFLDFLNILVQPTALTGNLGAPVLKTDLDAHMQKFIDNPNKFISSNVFISDNGSISKLERDSSTSEVEHDDTKVVYPNNPVGGSNIESTNNIDSSTQQTMIKTQQDDKSALISASPSGTNITNNDLVYTNNKQDAYTKPNITSNNSIVNSSSTIDQRNRPDVLNSSIVADNKNTDTSIPIYGNYKV